MKKNILITLMSFILFAPIAQAQSMFDTAINNISIGGSYSVNGSIAFDKISSNKLTFSIDDDNVSGSYKFFANAKLNDMFSIEGYYINFGNTIINVASGTILDGVTATMVNKNDIETASYGLMGVATMPVFNDPESIITNISIYGKAGFEKWNQDAAGFEEIKIDLDGDGMDFVYGVGFMTEISDGISIFGDFENYSGSEVGLFAIGASIKL